MVNSGNNHRSRERILFMLAKIQADPGCTSFELKDFLGVSMNTTRRDLNILRGMSLVKMIKHQFSQQYHYYSDKDLLSLVK